MRMLTDPLRVRIIELLADGPACVCHLVDDTQAKQPTVSHHLRALREAGLVAAEPHGRFTYYRLLPDALAEAGQRLCELGARAAAHADARREC
jgi:ArsR family transcriptional regulator, arsenate/arsenite/antimonite-responsive transcriptional repressor